jgi:hypothetical protein
VSRSVYVIAMLILYIGFTAGGLYAVVKAPRTKPKSPLVRWNDPIDFPCPVCAHKPAEHFKKDAPRHYGCGHLTQYAEKILETGYISLHELPRYVTRCLCARTQESLVQEADEWSFRPPSTKTLMGVLSDHLPIT